MILDFLHIGEIEREFQGAHLTVDGVLVNQAFYVDTEAGFVKSYDVFGDNAAHYGGAKYEGDPTPPIPEGSEMDPRGVLFKVVRGVVVLDKAA